MNLIQLETTIKASIESMWEAWTKEEIITRWFPPEARIEAKEGGAYELFFDPENHDHQSTKGCVITKIEPYKQLSFTWKGPDHFGETMNKPTPLTSVTVRFSEKDERVEVILKHKGWGEGEKWEEARNWHLEQWEIVLNDLRELLEG